jgi:hypothetical protein
MNLPDGSFISDVNAAYQALELTWPCWLTAASCVTSQFHAAQLGPLSRKNYEETNHSRKMAPIYSRNERS